MGWVPNRALVHGIEVQLEILVRFLAVVVWVALKPPAFQPAVSHVVCDGCVVLVVVFVGWFPRPFLYVLRIWPVWAVAVRDSFCMSGPGLWCQICARINLPVQVMPKSMPTMKSGCHASVDIVSEESRGIRCAGYSVVRFPDVARRLKHSQYQKNMGGWGEPKYQKAHFFSLMLGSSYSPNLQATRTQVPYRKAVVLALRAGLKARLTIWIHA